MFVSACALRSPRNETEPRAVSRCSRPAGAIRVFACDSGVGTHELCVYYANGCEMRRDRVTGRSEETL